MTLLSAQPPPFNAPPKAWEDFIASMEGAAARGDKNAEEWAKFGREQLEQAKTKAYDESQHPRDEHGRWTDGGGSDTGGSAKPSAAPPPAEQPSRAATVDRIVDLVPGAKEKIAAARAKLANGVPTHAPLSQGGFKRPDGHWSAARQAEHAKILETILSPE